MKIYYEPRGSNKVKKQNLTLKWAWVDMKKTTRTCSFKLKWVGPSDPFFISPSQVISRLSGYLQSLQKSCLLSPGKKHSLSFSLPHLWNLNHFFLGGSSQQNRKLENGQGSWLLYWWTKSFIYKYEYQKKWVTRHFEENE